MSNLTVIQEAFMQGNYQYTQHAFIRTTSRRISRSELEQVIQSGEIIEDYPHDKYGPSCLIFGTTTEKRPLHIQCSLPPYVKIITAYQPDPAEWIDYRFRRK